jgi:CheY-like chemotaxis protein
MRLLAESSIVNILDAIRGYLWPILAALVLWKLFPTIRQVLNSRGFSVKVGSMDISVQEASDSLANQVKDLQDKVKLLLEAGGASIEEAQAKAARAAPRRKGRILWVDDHPENNAFEIARLREDGNDVALARSTRSALDILSSQTIDGVITDMGRTEEGQYRATAGLDLIEQIRSVMDGQLPVFVYSRPVRTGPLRAKVEAAGATVVSGSPVDLLRSLE